MEPPFHQDNSMMSGNINMMTNITHEMVADWLSRLQRASLERQGASVAATSTGIHLGDEPDVMVEVQEFLPEEEITVVDVGESVTNDTVSAPVPSSSNCVAMKVRAPSPKEPPVQQREPLSYELAQGQRILRELMSDCNKSFVGPFLNPIDASNPGCADYYQRIKRPVWMRQMKEKFENGTYRTITEFVSDMRLMLENCYRYNGPDHPISRKAQRIETLLEQKLNLLSRELREKTTLTATSGKGLLELQHGSRRHKVLVSHDSSALLNELRREAAARDREARRQHMMEKRQSYEMFLQSLQSWEDSLLEGQHLGAMWEIPQICQFMLLCSLPLGLGEIAVYELERSFLMPRESSALQKVVTSLLSTPYQRTRLDNKPSMPYRIWNAKVTALVRQWYKVLADTGRDVNKVCQKTGLEEKFFKVMGMTNPLEYRQFHELSVYQRVWVIKSLCDYCVETQQCLCDAIEAQPSKDHRAMVLGLDSEGYTYIHFPQFCGADLRIYKQKVEEIVDCSTSTVKRSRPRRKRRLRRHYTFSAEKRAALDQSATTQRIRDSRLRQNPRQVQSFQVDADSSTTASDSSEDDSVEDDEESAQTEEEQPTPAKKFAKSTCTSVEPLCKQDDTPLKEQVPSDSVAEGSAVLRRSLRKIIEESKKDAVCTSSITSSRESTPQRSLRGNRRKSLRNVKSSPNISSASHRPPSPAKSSICSKDDMAYMEEMMCNSERSNASLVVPPKQRRVTRRFGRRRKCSKRRLQVKNSHANSETGSKDVDDSRSVTHSQLTSSPPQDKSQSVSVVDTSDAGSRQSSLCGDSEKTSGSGCPSVCKSESTESRNAGCFRMLNCTNLVNDADDYETDMDCLDKETKLPPSFMESSPHKSCEDAQKPDANDKGSPVITEARGHDREKLDESNGASSVKKENHDEADMPVKVELNDKALDDISRKTSQEMKSEVAPTHENHVDTGKASCDGDVKIDSKSVKLDDVPCSSSESASSETKDSMIGVERKGEVSDAVNEKGNEDMTQKSEEKTEPPLVKEEPPEILVPDASEFQLVADSIASLRNLVAKFASALLTQTEANAGATAEENVQPVPAKKSREAQLHSRLSSLLAELEPYEQKLIQLNKKMKIKLRKEHENYKEEMPDKEQTSDTWHSSDSDDSSSDDDTQSSVADAGSLSQPSTPAPSEGVTSGLRYSRRRVAVNEMQPVSRNRKRNAETNDALSSKRSKNAETSTASEAESSQRRVASTSSRSYSGIGLSSTATSSRVPVGTPRSSATSGATQRAVLRITQPNGTVCFLAINNVSDLSRLPVTAVVQQLMASQKLAMSTSNHRMPSFSHAGSVSAGTPQPQKSPFGTSKTSPAGHVGQGNLSVNQTLVSSMSSTQRLASLLMNSHPLAIPQSTANLAVNSSHPLGSAMFKTIVCQASEVQQVQGCRQLVNQTIPFSQSFLTPSAAGSIPASLMVASSHPLVAGRIQVNPSATLPVMSASSATAGVVPSSTTVALSFTTNQRLSTSVSGQEMGRGLGLSLGLSNLSACRPPAGLAPGMSRSSAGSAPSAVNWLSAIPYSVAAKSEAGQKLVLVNIPGNNVQALLGPLIGQRPILGLPNQSSVSGTSKDDRLLVNLIACQSLPVAQAAAGINASVPMTVSRPLSVGSLAASLFPSTALSSRPLAVTAVTTVASVCGQVVSPLSQSVSSHSTLEAVAPNMLGTSMMSLQAAGKLQPRYTSNMTVKALLEGRIASDVITLPASVALNSGIQLIAGGRVAMQNSGVSVTACSTATSVNSTQAVSLQPSVMRFQLPASAIVAGLQPQRPATDAAATANIVIGMPVRLPTSQTPPASKSLMPINGPHILTLQQTSLGNLQAVIPKVVSLGSSSQLPSSVGIAQLTAIGMGAASQPRPIPTLISVAASSPLRAAPLVPMLPQLVSANPDVSTLRGIIPQSRVRGPPLRAVRNNTRTTSVMKAPIPALPRLTEFGLSTSSSVASSVSVGATSLPISMSSPPSSLVPFLVADKSAQPQPSCTSSATAPSTVITIVPAVSRAFSAASTTTSSSPGVSAGQSVILLQSGNGLIQLVQLPAGEAQNLVRGQQLLPGQYLVPGQAAVRSSGQDQGVPNAVVMLRSGTAVCQPSRATVAGCSPFANQVVGVRSVSSSNIGQLCIGNSVVNRIGQPAAMSIPAGVTPLLSRLPTSSSTKIPPVLIMQPPHVQASVSMANSPKVVFPRVSTLAAGTANLPLRPSSLAPLTSLHPVSSVRSTAATTSISEQPSCLAEAANLFLMAAVAVDRSSVTGSSVLPPTSTSVRPSPLISVMQSRSELMTSNAVAAVPMSPSSVSNPVSSAEPR